MADINFHEEITGDWKRPGRQTMLVQTWTSNVLLALWPNMEVDETTRSILLCLRTGLKIAETFSTEKREKFLFITRNWMEIEAALQVL